MPMVAVTTRCASTVGCCSEQPYAVQLDSLDIHLQASGVTMALRPTRVHSLCMLRLSIAAAKARLVVNTRAARLTDTQCSTPYSMPLKKRACSHQARQSHGNTVLLLIAAPPMSTRKQKQTSCDRIGSMHAVRMALVNWVYDAWDTHTWGPEPRCKASMKPLD